MCLRSAQLLGLFMVLENFGMTGYGLHGLNKYIVIFLYYNFFDKSFQTTPTSESDIRIG